jgi:hypothetical protein
MAGLHATNQLAEEEEPPPPFAQGDKIEARYGGGTEYFPGTIGFIHVQTQAADIMYDDGDGESGVPFALIRSRAAAAPPASAAAAGAAAPAASKFAVGSEVDIRSFKGTWRPGTVEVIREEGSFDVKLTDGTIEKGVPPSLVRPRQAAAAGGGAGQPRQQKQQQQAPQQQQQQQHILLQVGNAAGPGEAGADPPSASTSAALAQATAALQLPVASKSEQGLHEELSVLVKAHERQMRSVEKNLRTIESLSASIAELEATLGE